MESLRLGFFMRKMALDWFWVELKLIDDGLAAMCLFFMEEISWQFIFIDLDEVDSCFGLAKMMMIAKSIGRTTILSMQFRGLFPRKTILSGNKLIVIHLIDYNFKDY